MKDKVYFTLEIYLPALNDSTEALRLPEGGQSFARIWKAAPHRLGL
ncbi:hypothetical protein [Azospirillum sp. INR13]|nr:hypothetical protein [Azospirillum sp. INR13]